jgi:hypothetical protein
MTIRAFHRFLVGFMLLRGAYAVAIFMIVSGFRLGWGNPFGITGYVAEVAHNITPGQTLIWAAYVCGYLIAALLALRSSRLALWVYALAMALDFWIWVLAAFNPSYNMIWAGQAGFVDIVFNIYDMGVLLCLIFLVHRRTFR